MYQDLVWVWDVFSLLNRQRQVGASGPQPTSMHDIFSICQLLRIQKSDDIELVLKTIPELDAVLLKDHYDRVEADAKKKNKKPKTR